MPYHGFQKAASVLDYCPPALLRRLDVFCPPASRAFLQPYSLHYNWHAQRYGLCDYSDKRIELHGVLGEADNPPWLLAQHDLTLGHEMAHALAHHFFNDHGHGLHWRHFDLALGGTGARLGPVPGSFLKAPVVNPTEVDLW